MATGALLNVLNVAEAALQSAVALYPSIVAARDRIEQ
jgi:hypothetical protein